MTSIDALLPCYTLPTRTDEGVFPWQRLASGHQCWHACHQLVSMRPQPGSLRPPIPPLLHAIQGCTHSAFIDPRCIQGAMDLLHERVHTT